METGSIIRDLRNKFNFTQEELGKKLDPSINRAAINKWESGETENIKRTYIEQLANIFKVSPAYIMGWEDEKPDVKPAIRVNVYGRVPAGIPVDAIEDIIDWEEIPAEWAKGGKEFIALEVQGDSMYPKYVERDRIIIERSPDCNSGDDCVVYVNGYESTLKTVIKNNDGSITLKPFNPSYSPRTYSQKSEDDFVEIFGIVREIRRKP